MNGPQPITLQEIVSYFALRGITDQTERDEYLSIIQAVDNAYLAAWAARAERDRQLKQAAAR